MDTTTTSEYIVKAGNFEGPLELLLELIEKRKFFINELSLAAVTEEYIAYIREPERNISLADMTYFLVIAATLVLIKSRSLLPQLALSKDEQGEIKNLEDRLVVYQKVREIAESVRMQYLKTPIYTRDGAVNDITVFAPDATVSVETLHAALTEVFTRMPKEEKLPEVVVRKVMSIEEMMDDLSVRIEQELSFSFKTISDKNPDATPREKRVFMIVSFLALLELVRGGMIDILQDNQFDDMRITKQKEEELFT